MHPDRRSFLKAIAIGAGGLGLRGLVAGIPASLLAAAHRAAAADACDATALAATDRPQRLVLITSAAGDPLNANVPGCYVDGVYHPLAAGFRPDDHGTLSLGNTSYACAEPWAKLVADHPAIGERLCFFHHATYSNAHGDHAKVNTLMGAIRRQELLVSLVARHVNGCAPATTQAAPVLLSNVLIRYAGAVLPVLDRNGLAAVLRPPQNATEASLRGLRDADLGRLNELLKGHASPAQAAAIDRYAASQAEARAVDPALVGSVNFSGPNESAQQQRNTTAAVILAMNVAPVVVMSYDFGGDNHSDYQLNDEAQSTTASVAALGDLWAKLRERNLHDDVTIICQNVFGRTLNAANRNGNTDGRDHNAAHHCTVIIGKGFTGSVIGGVTPTPSGNEFRAQAIDSRSGAAAAAGDVTYETSLASVGKTICAGVGLSRAVIEDQITIGKVVEAALAPELRTV